MYVEEIVEVTIGLIFIWFVLSLACMQAQEWIVALFGIRADSLEDALRGMLADPPETFGPLGRIWSQLLKFGWVRWIVGMINKMPGLNIRAALEEPPELLKDLYEHPLIKGLSQKGKKPSYIPADKFALALFDVVMTAGTPASRIKQVLQPISSLKDKLNEADPARAVLEKLLTLAAMANLHSDQLSDQTQAALVSLKTGLISFMEKFEDRFKGQPEFERLYQLKELLEAEPLEQLKRGAIELAGDNPKVTVVLTSLITQVEVPIKKSIKEVEGAIEEVESALARTRQDTEKWFNDTMDRLSGWYKRNRQVWAFCIALIFAAFFNVDSIEIADTLWREPALRKAVVSVAESYELPKNQNAAAQEDDYPTQLKKQTEETKQAIKQLQDTFVDLRIPIGWTGLPLDWNGWLIKVIGLSITGVAAMQGAPFWFDVLGKLINVRSAGKKPEEK